MRHNSITTTILEIIAQRIEFDVLHYDEIGF